MQRGVVPQLSDGLEQLATCIPRSKAATVAPITTESRTTFRRVTRLFFDHHVCGDYHVEVARGNHDADRVHTDRVSFSSLPPQPGMPHSTIAIKMPKAYKSRGRARFCRVSRRAISIASSAPKQSRSAARARASCEDEEP